MNPHPIRPSLRQCLARLTTEQRSYLTFFLVMVFGTISILGFLLTTAYRQAVHEAEVQTRNVASILEARLDATLLRVQSDLKEIAANQTTETLLAQNRNQYQQNENTTLTRMARAFPEVIGYRILDANGEVLYHSLETRVRSNARGRDYFEALKSNPDLPIVFSEVTIGRMVNRPMMFAAVPIKDRSGKFLGVVQAPLNLERLENLFQSVDLGTRGVVTFRRTDNGRLVMRQPPRPNGVNQALQNNPLHQRIEDGDREGIIHFSSALDNTYRIYAYKRVGQYPFYVASGIASTDYLAGWRKTATISGLAAILEILILILLFYRLLHAENQKNQSVHDLRDSESRFRLLLNSVGQALCGFDLSGHCTFANPACAAMLGYGAPDELLGLDIRTLLDAPPPWPPSASSPGQQILSNIQLEREFQNLDVVCWHLDGSNFSAEINAYPQYQDGQLVGGVITLSDITERKTAAEKIQYLALHDSLTGLANRLNMENQVNHQLQLAALHHQQMALLFIDLDHFKTINDSLGHQIGDTLLQNLAQRIQGCLRHNAVLSRQGGDEFLVLLPDGNDARQINQLMTEIFTQARRPIVIQGHELTCSLSIGVALYPSDGEDFATLLKHADMAMYAAKDAGRNTWRYFNQAMNQDAVHRLELRNSLLHALDRHEFTLHYQPQHDLQTGEIVGVEALLRWYHPEKGLISPIDFIPLAESTGMIIPIGEWVIREACHQQVLWHEAGLPKIAMAVNCSTLQFRREDLVRAVRSVLQATGLPPGLLELEITESVLISDSDSVLETLKHLKALGVALAIDDFGTGYSSLAYLKRFSVNKLKIDRSFVRDLHQQGQDTSIVQAIIQMGHSLNLKVLAEGVEDEATLDLLRELGCDEVQGYFISRPLSPEQIPAYIKGCQLTAP